jgi:deoxyadenosine/deoxycytidine kinase
MQDLHITQAPIVWVEGLISAGKTTFAKEMSTRLDMMFLPEPVEANPYLDIFYKDPGRWAWPMQIHLLHHRFGIKKAADYLAATGSVGGVIIDRCIAGDRVFCKLHHDAGNIHELEWHTYNYAYQMMARDIQPPTVMLYLDVQPETAFERCEKRARACEKSKVTLEYLKQLREGYEDLIAEMQAGLSPWAHGIEVDRFIWDGNTLSEEEWDRVAASLKATCERRMI